MEAAHQDHFQKLADGAPVMIWMSGLDSGCFYFNRAWLDFRGRSMEQEAGNGWAEGVHPEDIERCVGHYVGCFERRMAFAMTYRLRDFSGAYRWILDRGAPHFAPDRTFLGFFGGCAEIEAEASTTRHRQLKSSLVEMTRFAQRLASEEASRSPKGDSDHAAAELKQLATDMAAYGELPPGACLPRLSD